MTATDMRLAIAKAIHDAGPIYGDIDEVTDTIMGIIQREVGSAVAEIDQALGAMMTNGKPKWDPRVPVRHMLATHDTLKQVGS